MTVSAWRRAAHHPPVGVRDLGALLSHRAAVAPDAPLLTFLTDGEGAAITWTAAELHARACAVATALQSRASAGDRALLLVPQGLDFAAALFGCFLADVIAVPAPAPEPGDAARTADRVRAIAADADAAVVLTVHALLDAVDVPGVRIAVDRLPPGTPRPVSPVGPAYLQYTSGSTAAPKGVVVTHANLLHNCAELNEAYDLGPDSVMVSWVPTYHDLGLVYAVALPVFIGFHSVAMTPLHFVQRPIRWLAAIDRYRGTHSVAPNFAFDLAVVRTRPEERAGLDLSCWKVALNGAEPCRRSSEERFVEAFAPHGFSREAVSHSYGMSEATAKITGEHPGDRMRYARLSAAELEKGRASDADGGERTIDVASCGVPSGGTRVVAVDGAGAPVPDDVVGELWVAGGSVCPGYWRNDAATAATFGARTASGDGPFLRTGDLGFLREGRVYVTGRTKDLIIVRGENHYPQDVEAVAGAAHPAIRPGGVAAFAVDAGGTEALAVAAEVGPDAPLADVIDAIRAATSRIGLPPHLVALVPPRALPKTSSGKLQRAACRSALSDGSMPVLARWDAPHPGAGPVAGDGLALVTALAAAALGVGVDDVDVDRPLRELGLDSVDAVALVERIAAATGVPIAPAEVFDHPTLAALARLVGGRVAAVPVVPPRGAEAVAIAGFAVRLPGAPDLAAFHANLRAGVDAVGPFDRWGEPAVGGALPDVASFAASRFGMAPAEATALDPQQRLLLELAWEALEDAGIDPRAVPARTGVWTATGFDDYARGGFLGAGTPDPYALTGAMASLAAGRIAYHLGCRGPVLHVDAACASFPLAIHLACAALRAGECDVALVGAVNLLIAPEPSRYFALLGSLSPTGRCRAFSADADGYVRGEGGGVVVLRRATDAPRVLARIEGSGVAHGGRALGLTAPNGEAQQHAARAALAMAGWAPGDVGYVEAHGTGTPLGDQVELRALAAVYPSAVVGASKTYVGNLEPASGVPALAEALLAVRGVAPAILHLGRRHPDLPATFTLPTACLAVAAPRVAVHSYGLSGTTVHLLLSAGDAEIRPVVPPPRERYWRDPVPAAAVGAAPAPVAVSEAAIVDTIREVLGVVPDPDVPLHDAGLDSLRAIALRNRLHERTGLELPLALFVDRPSVARILAAAGPATPVEAAPDRPVALGSHVAAAVAGAVVAAAILQLWGWIG